MRPDTVKRKGKPSSKVAHQIPPSRQNTTLDSQKRPLTATQNAPPQCVVADPDFATVADAWQHLPKAIRSSILTLVRAFAKE
jgi:hypothetical protein